MSQLETKIQKDIMEAMKAKDAVEVALCFGWIDSTLKHIDSGKPLQRFSPRRRGTSFVAIYLS